MRLSNLRHDSKRVLTRNFGIMLVDILLNNRKWLVCELFGFLRLYFLKFCQEVCFHVFVSIALEYISWEFNTIVTCSMDEVAEITSCTSSRAVEVSARNGSIVWRLYQLIWVVIDCLSLLRYWPLDWVDILMRISVRQVLVLLCKQLLSFLNFVLTLEFFYLFSGHKVELLVFNILICTEKLHNFVLLI